MKVKAIRLGYYGLCRRRPGVVFTLTDEKHFSKEWMEKVTAKKASKKKESTPEPEAETTPTGDKDLI